MSIEKEQQMILGHLQPKKMNGNLLEENSNYIKQLDWPPDSRNRKIVSIGKQNRWTRNTLLDMGNNHLNWEVV